MLTGDGQLLAKHLTTRRPLTALEESLRKKGEGRVSSGAVQCSEQQSHDLLYAFHVSKYVNCTYFVLAPGGPWDPSLDDVKDEETGEAEQTVIRYIQTT